MNARFQEALARLDAENAQDAQSELAGDQRVPRELLYARRLTVWVLKLDPGASETLLLAARSQHIRRWEIPRSDFPADKAGYHRWRAKLKAFHAQIAAGILRECGYDDETIARVRELNLKTRFPIDPDSRTLEDALCLVFLEFQLAELAARTEHDKLVNALRKSWAKMTERGRAAALSLKFGEAEARLIAEAIAPTGAQP